MNAPVLAASDAAAADAAARYQRERAACNNGQSSQERATCLREASAAHAQMRKNGVQDHDMAFEQNAQKRCQAVAEPGPWCLPGAHARAWQHQWQRVRRRHLSRARHHRIGRADPGQACRRSAVGGAEVGARAGLGRVRLAASSRSASDRGGAAHLQRRQNAAMKAPKRLQTLIDEGLIDTRRAPADERQGSDGLRRALRRRDPLRQGLQGG